MAHLDEIVNAVVAGNIGETRDLARRALDDAVPAEQVIENGLVSGLRVVGDRFECGEMFLPDMLLSALAAKAGMEVAQESLSRTSYAPKATIVIGTVKGDLHDIGKNLVATVLQSSGFKVVDLGIDVSTEMFLSAVKDHRPRFLGLSCLISTCMPEMIKVIDAVDAAGLRDGLKIVVGGAPTSQEFATKIRADGYARDAARGVRLLEEWLKHE